MSILDETSQKNGTVGAGRSTDGWVGVHARGWHLPQPGPADGRETDPGKPPLRVTRLGVTGHRVIPAEAYGHVLDGLSGALRPHRRPLEVLSSLAIGADQIFAELALDHGARLTAVLPAADYETTFAPAELARFHCLLGRAHARVVLDYAEVCDEAYYAAGTYIADHCDLVLAVWDGCPARGPGGTADVVHYAREVGRPVSVIWKPGVVRD